MPGNILLFTNGVIVQKSLKREFLIQIGAWMQLNLRHTVHLLQI